MPDHPDGYVARKVIEKMTNTSVGVDWELARVNAAHVSMEAARRILCYLPPDHSFAEIQIPSRIIQMDSVPFERAELGVLQTDQLAEKYLDETCFRMAEALATVHVCAKLDSPKDAIMAARTVDQKRGLIITVAVIPSLIQPYLKAVLMAGVA